MKVYNPTHFRLPLLFSFNALKYVYSPGQKRRHIQESGMMKQTTTKQLKIINPDSPTTIKNLMCRPNSGHNILLFLIQNYSIGRHYYEIVSNECKNVRGCRRTLVFYSTAPLSGRVLIIIRNVQRRVYRKRERDKWNTCRLGARRHFASPVLVLFKPSIILRFLF